MKRRLVRSNAAETVDTYVVESKAEDRNDEVVEKINGSVMSEGMGRLICRIYDAEECPFMTVARYLYGTIVKGHGNDSGCGHCRSL